MKIYIQDLTFDCIIGILDFERKQKQKVIVNISFDYVYSKNYFIDYSKVSKYIKKKMIKKKFKLLEDAIFYFEKKLNKKYKIKNLNIKITKPNILKDCLVCVSN